MSRKSSAPLVHRLFHRPLARCPAEAFGRRAPLERPDFSADFYTFAVDWEPGSIVWYVDGVERALTTKGVPDEPMYLIANLAVGGDWPGNPDATTVFPGYMDIDYIRVYQR